ncbi:MAG: indoleacetamide hydrolase [Burkholderiaceae bacterium]|nr:MAG: indoleacetamide hydrolase [Burkholderiaceae bacterium]TAM11002.1 MAG: indoleacetamide hydrolase [Pusillimonas sp.]
MDLFGLTVRQARAGLLKREFSCAEYVEALLARAGSFPEVNAWVARDLDQLRRDAAALDSSGRLADANLPLAGIPIAVKDNIDVVGLPCAAGTGALKDRHPANNAGVVSDVLDAGALVAGKTGMHELAMGVTSNNGVTGAVRNPYDLRRVPGGSSGGSAAAVAAGFAPAALGTDTGGSVRLPAALCGLVGLRPTIGRYATDGVVPLCRTRDTVGPIARTVADVALLDSILSGDDASPSVDLAGLRLGVPRDTLFDDLEAGVAQAVQDVLRQLEKSGVVLVEADVPRYRELDEAVGFPLVFHELERDLPEFLAAGGMKLSLADVHAGIGSPDVAGIVAMLLDGHSVGRKAYREALRQRSQMQAVYFDYFRRHRLDGVIFPTTPMPATPVGEDVTVELNGEQVPTFATFIRNTDPGSVAGVPGISVPAGLSAGLPVGVEIDGLPHSDRWLLAVAAVVERFVPALPPPGFAGRQVVGAHITR